MKINDIKSAGRISLVVDGYDCSVIYAYDAHCSSPGGTVYDSIVFEWSGADGKGSSSLPLEISYDPVNGNEYLSCRVGIMTRHLGVSVVDSFSIPDSYHLDLEEIARKSIDAYRKLEREAIRANEQGLDATVEWSAGLGDVYTTWINGPLVFTYSVNLRSFSARLSCSGDASSPIGRTILAARRCELDSLDGCMSKAREMEALMMPDIAKKLYSKYAAEIRLANAVGKVFDSFASRVGADVIFEATKSSMDDLAVANIENKLLESMMGERLRKKSAREGVSLDGDTMGL